MQENKSPLYIPVKVNPGKQYFSGFGQKELILTLCGFTVSIIPGLVVYAIKGVIILTLIVMGIITMTTLFLVVRNKNNESIIDMIRLVRRYFKRQKVYIFEYYDIYQNYKKGEAVDVEKATTRR